MMLSQRFNVSEQNSPTFPIKALSYSSLPTSPRGTAKHEPEANPAHVKKGHESGKHVFIPQKDDMVNHRFRLRYSPCSDAYHRDWDDCALTRFGGGVRGWAKGVYSFESVERIVDAKTNLVYLERKPGCNTGILTWKIDFGCCGLVVDQVSIKVASHHVNGGEVLVMLSGDETKKTISHMEGLGLVAVNGFENSKSLLLSVHLIGETPEQQTRLFEKNILSKGDYPLDLKATLKPPVEMYNKPVLLLGLMFSYNQETSVDRRHYRTHSTSSGRGFLHLNIVQGKNMTSSKDSAPDAQVKCYLLPDDKNIKSCKTGRAKKSCSPIWDEYFVIDGVAQSQLRKKQLGVRVVNWHLGINRKNSRLGELRIGCTEAFDFNALPSLKISPRKEETTNEGIIYSPLIPVNEEQQRKRELCPPCDKTDKKGVEKSVSDTLDSVFFDHENGHIPSDADKKLPENKNCSTLLENLKRLNDERRGSDVKKTLQESNSGDQHAKTDEDTATDENEKKQTGSKPRRPPPPNLLKLKEGLHVDNNSTTKQDDKSEMKIQASPRRVHTPTTSRLMMKLPMSPRRDRRSSWGGESDMSLASPRSITSPRGYDGLESRQWDFMITRPKEWIYCWQKLDINLS